MFKKNWVAFLQSEVSEAVTRQTYDRFWIDMPKFSLNNKDTKISDNEAGFRTRVYQKPNKFPVHCSSKVPKR